jgi:predicted enzyme related to lactoylglutathione lyase
MTNICSDDLISSKQFYTSLFELKVGFESDWFVQLTSDSLELGIISRQSELIPEEFQKKPQGFYITFVVENVDVIFEKAKAAKMVIVTPPQNTFYGQRRLLLKDPNGVLIDVSAPIENFEFNP